VLPDFTRVGDAVTVTVGLEQTVGPGGITTHDPPVIVPLNVVPQLSTQVEPEHVLAAVHAPLGTQLGGGAVQVASEGGGALHTLPINTPVFVSVPHVLLTEQATEQFLVPAIVLVLQSAFVAVQVLVVQVFAAQLVSTVHTLAGGGV
jgi:hypothetical protein